jgi:hypothetical protein
LNVDARDAQPHAAGPARRGTAAATAPADGGEPVEARQPARPGPAVGASLGGALIGHGPDHTGAAVSPPGGADGRMGAKPWRRQRRDPIGRWLRTARGPAQAAGLAVRPGAGRRSPPKPEGAPRILGRRWQMHRAR